MALLIGILVYTAGLLQSLQAQPKPVGELVYAFHVTLSPNWFDPAGTPAQITPFGVLYALHDALVRPLAGGAHGASPGRGVE
jgi:peptide/nickel transport system substrate-binding protein